MGLVPFDHGGLPVGNGGTCGLYPRSVVVALVGVSPCYQ